MEAKSYRSWLQQLQTLSVSSVWQILQNGGLFYLAQFALSKDEATHGWQKRALRQD
jgi:hypothetical protein